MKITTLDSTYLTLYKEMILEAYETSSESFTSTRGEREKESNEWWADRIEENNNGFVVGALLENTLVGTVAIEYLSRKKVRHKAKMVGMYVVSEHRNHGIGKSLLNYALEKLSRNTDIRTVVLTVTQGNQSAIELYRTVGFKTFGVEPMAIFSENKYYSKEHMALQLNRENA